MRSYEKEALFKGFFLFFSTLLVLNAIIFYLYFNEKKQALHVDIFNQIKLYNYNFKDKDMIIDIVPHKDVTQLYKLFIKKGEIYAYFDIPTSKKNVLKIIYPHKKYQKKFAKIKSRSLWYFLISSFILLLLSIFYSFYTIRPIKKALNIMEMFLKDIIHDLNTPVSSIFLNLNILKRKSSPKAIERIELSAKNIGSLYSNLESLIKDAKIKNEQIDLESFIKERVNYFSYIYPNIKFETTIKAKTINTSLVEFSRIVNNLISNACKYNRENGFVKIYIDSKKLIIEDSGVGIKNPKKVFERFYKESDRGLGLGLNIVKKLIDTLGYKIEIKSKVGVGTTIEVSLK